MSFPCHTQPNYENSQQQKNIRSKLNIKRTVTQNPQEWQLNESILQVRNLTKRLELSFLNVFALPKDSSIGLVFNISYSIPLPPPRAAKYCIAIFAVSVFPAPLSPLKMQMITIIIDPNSNTINN